MRQWLLYLQSNMMTIPVFILAFFFPPSDKPLSYDFGKDAGNDWRVIVDGVMGGLSTGNVAVLENSMVFTGSISLENNGGFSSLRAPFGKYDLSDYSAVEIRYRSTGGEFTFMMEKDRRFWVPYFALSLPDTDSKWTTIRMDLDAFDVRKLGEKTGRTMEAKERDSVIRIGFMKLDKKTGPFMLEVDYLNFIQ